MSGGDALRRYRFRQPLRRDDDLTDLIFGHVLIRASSASPNYQSPRVANVKIADLTSQSAIHPPTTPSIYDEVRKLNRGRIAEYSASSCSCLSSSL